MESRAYVVLLTAAVARGGGGAASPRGRPRGSAAGVGGCALGASPARHTVSKCVLMLAAATRALQIGHWTAGGQPPRKRERTMAGRSSAWVACNL